MNFVAKNIKKLRLERGLNQGQLAAICGWGESQARISHYETGIRIPNADDLVRISNALDCAVGDLFDGDEYQKSTKISPEVGLLAHKLSKLSSAQQKLILQMIVEILKKNK